MPEITLNIDSEANKTVRDLMNYYNLKSEAEIFGLGLKLIGITAFIDNSNGEWELIARKKKKNGEDKSHETRITGNGKDSRRTPTEECNQSLQP